jgi:hypothetical protein
MYPHAKQFKTSRSPFERQRGRRLRPIPSRTLRTRVTGGAPRIVTANET